MTRVFDLGEVVVMTSQHQPRNGKPMHVTRVWSKLPLSNRPRFSNLLPQPNASCKLDAATETPTTAV